MNTKAMVITMVLACVVLTPIVMAAEGLGSTSSPQVEGTWEFKSQMQARTSNATMTITKTDGKLSGTWSTQRGENPLSDIKFEGNKLTFVQTMNFGGNEMKTSYDLTVDGKKLKGTSKGQFGESNIEGEIQGEAKDTIVGTWNMTVNMPAREVVEKLTVTKNADGKFEGKWEGMRGESKISNIKLDGKKLTFTRTSNFGGREMMSDYEGTLESDKITGKFSSERGDREANATRAGAKTEMPKVEPKKEEAKPAPKAEPNKPK